MILVDRDGPEGRRLYLADDGIHCGDRLEIKLANGQWLAGRYEVTWDANGKHHVMYFGLANGQNGVVGLQAGLEARRPER